MANNNFTPGRTDQGKPRAAKGGFPYPGHGSLAEVELQLERRRTYQRERYARLFKSERVG